MASQITSTSQPPLAPMPIIKEGLPILYEDDKEADLGESNPHVMTDVILLTGLKAHLARQPQYHVFSNMNLYYQRADSFDVSPLPYVSPDIMVVIPFGPLEEEIRSYRIGTDGPAPILTIEILSERSFEQRDLDEKVTLYAKLGVAEYILVDVTGKFLPQRLLLKRLQADRTWKDEQDPVRGITSNLSFRLIIDRDGALRVVDTVSGRGYIRPFEAEAEAEKRRQAEERLRELEKAYQAESEARRQVEAELARLRQQLQQGQKS